MHKKVCSEVTETTFVKETFLPPQGLPTDPSSPMNDMLEKMYSMNIRPFGQGQAPEMPKFHDEYKKVYPRDVAFYTKLRDSWVMSKMLTKEIVLKELSRREVDHRIFMKRWGPCALSHELRVFLSNNPKQGDIFSEKPSEAYGYLPGQQIYQSMRNSPVTPQTFELGETYVAIGFVDMFPLVVGSFVTKDKDGTEQEPMVYYGYDKSVIVIARNIVLYHMMKNVACIDSILQVWFSTGWSKKTLDNFHLSCSQVLQNLDYTFHCDLAMIKELLTHWMKTTLSMKSVQILWMQHIEQCLLHPLPNLYHEKDRVEYARYLSTGHIFGSDKSDFLYGNLSMFSLPDSFQGFKREQENILAAIAMDSLEYDDSLLVCVTKKITKGLQKLRELIKSGSIICHFINAEFNLQEQEKLKEIKKLNAKGIDWSNLPDYLNQDDFFIMAQSCDGSSTLHSLHFMNWLFFVYGTCLIDYPNMTEVYKELVHQREVDFRRAKGSRPFFRQDHYIEYYMNTSQHVLGKRYMKTFIDFVFGGRNVDVREPISEDFNPFSRNEDTFFLSFTFRK